MAESMKPTRAMALNIGRLRTSTPPFRAVSMQHPVLFILLFPCLLSLPKRSAELTCMSMLGHFLDAYLECKRTCNTSSKEKKVHACCWHHSLASTLDRNGRATRWPLTTTPIQGNKWSGLISLDSFATPWSVSSSSRYLFLWLLLNQPSDSSISLDCKSVVKN